MRKLLMMFLAITILLSGSVMLTSCAKEQMKDDQALMADEKAKKEAEEKARMERERLAREKAIQEERLKSEQEKQLRAEFENKKIFFAFDSAVLSDESQDILREKADFLKQHDDKKVLIEGHCDDRGSVEYNLALGQRRAEAAMKYLTLLGIPSDRIRTISYGKERPINTANTEEAWAENRRDEFILE